MSPENSLSMLCSRSYLQIWGVGASLFSEAAQKLATTLCALLQFILAVFGCKWRHISSRGHKQHSNLILILCSMPIIANQG